MEGLMDQTMHKATHYRTSPRKSEDFAPDNKSETFLAHYEVKTMRTGQEHEMKNRTMTEKKTQKFSVPENNILTKASNLFTGLSEHHFRQ